MPLRLSKGFKVTIGIIGGILGLLAFLLLLGYIIDCFTYPALKKTGDRALKSLMACNRNEPGNAWDYYSAVIEKSKNIKSSIMWDKYLEGFAEITQEILQSIKDNEDAVMKLKQGAKQNFCSIPYDYSKGIAVKIPDFMTLRKITEITCIKGLYEVEEGKTKQGLDDILSVMTVGNDIANSVPNLLNQMIGVVFLNQAMKVLKIGLSTDAFNLSEFNMVSDSLKSLEKSLPMLASGLDGEKKQCEISLANLPFYKSVRGFAGLFFYENKIPSIFERIVFRFYCWRYFFSPRLAVLKGFKYMDYIISQMKELEINYAQKTKKEQDDSQIKESLYENAKIYAKKNPVFSTMFPNFISLYNRKCEAITKIRILRLSCSIQAYYFENNGFPEGLQEIGGNIITDLNTGNMWNYTNYGDSCEIYSPGPNPESTQDDISITLTGIGIKEYLKKKRKGISE